jgi:hypothetical protein
MAPTHGMLTIFFDDFVAGLLIGQVGLLLDLSRATSPSIVHSI